MDSWRVVPAYKALYIANNIIMFKVWVYCNGAIHWLCLSESRLLFFDVDKECHIEIPVPRIRGGHLHLIQYEKDFSLKFDVL